MLPLIYSINQLFIRLLSEVFQRAQANQPASETDLTLDEIYLLRTYCLEIIQLCHVMALPSAELDELNLIDTAATPLANYNEKIDAINCNSPTFILLKKDIAELIKTIEEKRLADFSALKRELRQDILAYKPLTIVSKAPIESFENYLSLYLAMIDAKFFWQGYGSWQLIYLLEKFNQLLAFSDSEREEYYNVLCTYAFSNDEEQDRNNFNTLHNHFQLLINKVYEKYNKPEFLPLLSAFPIHATMKTILLTLDNSRYTRTRHLTLGIVARRLNLPPYFTVFHLSNIIKNPKAPTEFKNIAHYYLASLATSILDPKAIQELNKESLPEWHLIDHALDYFWNIGKKSYDSKVGNKWLNYLFLPLENYFSDKYDVKEKKYCLDYLETADNLINYFSNFFEKYTSEIPPFLANILGEYKSLLETYKKILNHYNDKQDPNKIAKSIIDLNACMAEIKKAPNGVASHLNTFLIKLFLENINSIMSVFHYRLDLLIKKLDSVDWKTIYRQLTGTNQSSANFYAQINILDDINYLIGNLQIITPLINLLYSRPLKHRLTENQLSYLCKLNHLHNSCSYLQEFLINYLNDARKNKNRFLAFKEKLLEFLQDIKTHIGKSLPHTREHLYSVFYTQLTSEVVNNEEFTLFKKMLDHLKNIPNVGQLAHFLSENNYKFILRNLINHFTSLECYGESNEIKQFKRKDFENAYLYFFKAAIIKAKKGEPMPFHADIVLSCFLQTVIYIHDHTGLKTGDVELMLHSIISQKGNNIIKLDIMSEALAVNGFFSCSPLMGEHGKGFSKRWVRLLADNLPPVDYFLQGKKEGTPGIGPARVPSR